MLLLKFSLTVFFADGFLEQITFQGFYGTTKSQNEPSGKECVIVDGWYIYFKETSA